MKKILLIIFMGLIFGANSFAIDITTKKTKNHNFTAKPSKDHFMINTETVRAGKQSQKFKLSHGSCYRQDCKWSAQRSERELKISHKSKKKVGTAVYYAWSIFLPKEFEVSWAGSKMIIGQVKMKGVGMPVWEMNTRGAGFHIRGNHSIVKAKLYCGRFKKGEWTDIIIKADYAKKKSEDKKYKFFETWINGKYIDSCAHKYPLVKKKTFKESNSSDVGNAAGKLTFRYGIYRPNVGLWLERSNKSKPKNIKYFVDPDGGERVITHPFKLDWEVKIPTATIYYDEIRVGKSKDEVDLNLLNKPVD